LDLTRPDGVSAYCENLARGKSQASALQAACEFALSLRWKLPNVIGEEERDRYKDSEIEGEEQRNRVTAKVRYEDGQEQYSQITVDGKAIHTAVQNSALIWSVGEFASALRGVFLPQSATEFKFSKEEVLHSTKALVFDFRVERKNNQLWRLDEADRSTFPGYQGRLWINQSNLHLMRMQRQVDAVEADFPMQRVSTLIEYRDIALADGTNFVLPVRAVNTSCPTEAPGHCWHDGLTFKHWQKFAARARVLTPQDAAPAGRVAIAPVPELGSIEFLDSSRGASLKAEILGHEIAEVEPVRASERGEESAGSRLEPSKNSLKAEAAPQPTAAEGAGTGAGRQLPGDQLPVFQASARLVLVPAVVRDSRGRTVDNLEKSSFRLLDERKPQVITQFSLERPVGLVTEGPEPRGVEERQGGGVTAMQYVAYVFDDIHAALNDLANSRDAARRHLAELPPGNRVAIIALSGSVALDFTDNAMKVAEALNQLKPHPLTASGSVRCPDISYALADLIRNQDPMAIEQATQDALRCAFAGDKDAAARRAAEAMARDTAAQVLIAGRAESQTSFEVMLRVVQRISMLKGQRSIVLVSPGFPMAEIEEKSSKIVDEALRAQVIISVLDPSGLSTKDPVEVGSMSAPSDVLVDFASGTGGVFFHNRNDLKEGFERTAPPDVFYVLGFAPQKLDGKFHKLSVSLQAPEKLNVEARRGYYARKATN
jgi:VWFA-related protein